MSFLPSESNNKLPNATGCYTKNCTAKPFYKIVKHKLDIFNMSGSWILALPTETKIYMAGPMLALLVLGIGSKMITYRVLTREKKRPINTLIWLNQVLFFIFANKDK